MSQDSTPVSDFYRPIFVKRSRMSQELIVQILSDQISDRHALESTIKREIERKEHRNP